MTVLLFLGFVAATILGGARLAIWIYDENQRVNQVMRDGLAQLDADNWNKDEWWR